MQYDLRKAMPFLNAMVLIKPEIFIGGAGAKFDPQGHGSDETTRKLVTAQIAAFEKWIAAVKRMNAAS